MKTKLFIYPSSLSLIWLISCSEGVKRILKCTMYKRIDQNQPEIHGTEVKEGEIAFSIMC